MKKLILAALLTLFSYHCFATETFQYYIYVQTTYSQGFWARANLLKGVDQFYLANKQYEDLFRLTGDGEDVAKAIVQHLKEEKPMRYNFSFTIKIEDNVVVFSTKSQISDFDAVKNELTVSFILNNFRAVKIVQGKNSKIYYLKDVSIPYMDLVLPPRN